MSNYNVKAVCVLLSTDIVRNKQFVLSLNETEIVFPIFDVDDNFLKNPSLYLVEALRQHIFISDLDLLSQLTSIKASLEVTSEDIKNHLYLMYGLITPKSINLSDGTYWKEFSYHIENKYSNILLEVTHKLQ